MKITEVKQIGKSENYKIYLDGSYFLTLNIHTIYTHHLVLGTQVSQEQLEKVQFEGEKTLAFDKAVALLSKGSKTTKEMKDYLAKKGYTHQVCDYVSEKLESYKYLNDEEYARLFVLDRKNQKGKLLLKQLLLKKGVSKENIEKALEGLKQEDEIATLCHKYMKNKNKTSEDKQKLYRYLLSRGFSYDEVNQAVNQFFKESQDDWY